MIYFDHNATTPIDDRVIETMLPFFRLFYGNPSSLYRQGRYVRSAIDTAREQVAALVGVRPMQVVFTSGGTEANNSAFTVLNPGDKLAISAIEHPSVSEPAQHLAQLGNSVMAIKVDRNGIINEDEIDQAIEYKPTFVSMMLANNETGVIQDIAAISRQFIDSGSCIHTDAVQALGKIPVDFNELGVNLMSVSSHKIYGPKGCGALITSKESHIKPIILGGGQERGLRSGTENVPAIVGFGKAAELAQSELVQRTETFSYLRKLLEDRLTTIPGLTIFAKEAPRLPNTVQFGIEGMDGEMLLMKLDRKGIAVSSGSACASGGGQSSPVLSAMGVAEELAKSAIRVSLGKDNTEADVIEFFNQLETLVNQGVR
ncbi:MAG: cysteine desulfurase [Methylococcaceae bacterium]|nr:cysteine desulfurase [Methylococcaceae bacterium]